MAGGPTNSTFLEQTWERIPMVIYFRERSAAAKAAGNLGLAEIYDSALAQFDPTQPAMTEDVPSMSVISFVRALSTKPTHLGGPALLLSTEDTALLEQLNSQTSTPEFVEA